MYILKQKEYDHASVFSDAEFKMIKKNILRASPLLEDAGILRDRIGEIKEVITAILTQEEGCFDRANMVLPTLNFMARLASEPEYFLDWEEPIKKEAFLSEPKTGKHIAIYVPKKKDTLGLKIQTEKISYEFYSDVGELLQHVKEGWIYGIIALQENKNSVEASLRHRLKNKPGWDHDSAQAYLLPPCFDIIPAYYKEITGIMLKLAEGEYEPNSYGKDFSLKKALPHLLAHMNVPVFQKVKIGVVDDEPQTIKGILTILQAWPEVEPVFIRQDRESREIAELLADSDILLLDEDMGEVKGSQIARDLKATENFAGVIASISGMKPKSFPSELHFQLKGVVDKHYEAAKDFVSFVNRLLIRADI